MKPGPYLAKEKITPDAPLPSRIGVSVQAVHRYVGDERVPHRDVMQRIIEHTHGEVQPNDFFERAVA